MPIQAELTKRLFEHFDAAFPTLPQRVQNTLMHHTRAPLAAREKVHTALAQLLASALEDLLDRLGQLPFSPVVAAATLFRVWSLPKEWGPHFEGPSLAAGWRLGSLESGGYPTLQECTALLQLCLPALRQQEERFPEQTGLGYNSLFSETRSTKIDWDASASGVDPEELASQMVAWLESTAIAAQKTRALGDNVDMQHQWAISAANAMHGRLASIWLLESSVAPQYTSRALVELRNHGVAASTEPTPGI